MSLLSVLRLKDAFIVFLALVCVLPAFASNDAKGKITPILAILLLDNSESTTNKAGILIDSPVKGLGYITSSGRVGTTNLNGEYSYVAGDTVKFYLDTVELGETNATALTSVLEFSHGEQVAVLLQSLDTDGNPNNGIQVSQDTARLFTAANIQVSEVDANDEGFISRFEQKMGYPLNTDNFNAYDHARNELKKEVLKRYDSEFFQYLVDVVRVDGDVGANASGTMVFGRNPNIYLNSQESRLRLYFYARYIRRWINMEVEMLANQTLSTEETRLRIQKTSDRIADFFIFAGAMKTGYDKLELISLAKNSNSFKPALELFVREIGGDIASEVVQVLLDLVPEKNHLVKRVLENCAFIAGATPLGCTAQLTTSIGSGLSDIYANQIEIERTRARNAQLIANAYLYMYYLFDRRAGVLGDIYTLLAEELGLSDQFNTYDQTNVSDFEQVIYLLARHPGVIENNNNPFASITYYVEDVKDIIVKYQAQIEDVFLDTFKQNFDPAIIQSIANQAIDVALTLEKVDNNNYKVCAKLNNSASFDLKEIDVQVNYSSSLYGGLSSNGYSVNLLPVGGSSVNRCSSDFSVGLPNDLMFYDTIQADYSLSYSIDRILGRTSQTGAKHFEISTQTTIDDLAYPLVNVLSPVIYIREGETLTLDASPSYSIIDGDTLSFAWEYMPSAAIAAISLSPLNQAIVTGTMPQLPDGDAFQRLRFKVTVTSDINSKSSEKIVQVFLKPSSVLPPITGGVLNDTGITWGGSYTSGNNATCTSNMTIGSGANAGSVLPQDCDTGRDATHNDNSDGHAGFSYTKISSTGAELSASATSWSCVKDNITGLIWEKKTDDNGIHDKDNTYKWGGVGHEGSNYGTYYNDWDTLVNGSNAGSGLCGYTDWRVPSVGELESLVNFNQVSPSIDTTYFPNTPASHFWSASPGAGYSPSAWNVYFNNGNSDGHLRDYSFQVRLVRSGQ